MPPKVEYAGFKVQLSTGGRVMSTELGLPFALRKHVPAAVPPKELLGGPDQEWTWKPSGNLDTRDLEIYASGGNSTARQSGCETW
jgi:hypothetical protein